MLLGLDLASRLTGWCCGDGGSIPACGAWPFPEIDGNYGLLLATLEDYLDVTHRRFGFEAVAYEAPILKIQRFRDAAGEMRVTADKLSKLRLLYPLGAFVEWWCLRHDVECFEVTIAAIKKEVTGNAYAEKDDLVAIARKVGLELPAKSAGADDAADAWGAWLLLLRHMNTDLSRGWDKRIWTPKGALL